MSFRFLRSVHYAFESVISLVGPLHPKHDADIVFPCSKCEGNRASLSSYCLLVRPSSVVWACRCKELPVVWCVRFCMGWLPTVPDCNIEVGIDQRETSLSLYRYTSSLSDVFNSELNVKTLPFPKEGQPLRCDVAPCGHRRTKWSKQFSIMSPHSSRQKHWYWIRREYVSTKMPVTRAIRLRLRD